MDIFNEISFTIYGEPKTLQRHRDTIRETKNGIKIRKKYDPSSEDKKILAWKAIATFKPDRPFVIPIKLKLIFYMKRPKNHYGTGKNSDKLKGSAPVFHTKKPDIDNLAKLFIDAMNGIYWKDDTVISTLICRKVYTEGAPRTDVCIKEDSLTKK